MQTIKDQFNDMLNRSIIPCFEYEMSNDEYLLVNLQISDKGIEFSFDSDNLDCSFDGEIETINSNHYVLLFDEYFEDLDYYLQMIDNNIIEGYLLPNNLYK